MLLLTPDALLLLLLTLCQGVLFKKGLEKLFRTETPAGILEHFLLGLVLSTVYFSLVSFFMPVDYRCLLPLLLLHGLLFVYKRAWYGSLAGLIQQRATWLFSGPRRWAGIGLLLLLILYFIKPPGNPDSPGYHYLSIYWYEHYKAVPGLANVHGRYAFNPASFILQAAYGFTALTGRSLYPLNSVVTALFLCWLLARTLLNRHRRSGLVYFILLLILGRETMGNMSSPASDVLVLICIVYSILRFFEHLQNKACTLPTLLIPMVIALFAPIAKLSAWPLGLIFLMLLLSLPEAKGRWDATLRLLPLALLVYLPWLGRNVILSGWLVYPLPFIDVFHVDWKVPKEVLLLDYQFARYSPIVGPIGGSYDLSDLHFHNWFVPWLRRLFVITPVVALVLVAALCSPAVRLAVYIVKRKTAGASDLLYWLVYAMLWAWLLSSPDARFGMGALSLCIALPLMLSIGSQRKAPVYAIPVLLCVFVAYYLAAGAAFFRMDRQKRIAFGTINNKNPLIYPLQHPAYVHTLVKPQPYVLLANGVRMYHAIPGQPCNENCFPCMPWSYGELEMRGKNLEDGFRNIRVSIPKGHPVSPDILPVQ